VCEHATFGERCALDCPADEARIGMGGRDVTMKGKQPAVILCGHDRVGVMAGQIEKDGAGNPSRYRDGRGG